MYGETKDLPDTALLSLGIHRIEVPVPFLEAGGPANVYAIEEADGRFALFDTGIGNAEGHAALKAGLAQHSLDLSRLSRILVSHGHIDHFGNAQWLSEQSGARVFIHDADREKVMGDARFAALLRKHRAYFLGALGVPVETLDEMQAFADRSRSDSKYLQGERLGSLVEGQRFEFKHFEVEVKHLPGHTPGLVCLWAERVKIFFADDHVLARVSPNPVLDFTYGEAPATKFRALSRYLEGAKWVRDLDLEMVLPGHGPAFSGHRALLDGLLEFYVRRQDRIAAKLAAGPATVFELLPALFPRNREPARLVLMLSELLANVEVLEDAGRVVREDGDVVRYRLH
ncbi:MAG: MBL fold metallo-hydrolase [Myxococcaceae bacterium]